MAAAAKDQPPPTIELDIRGMHCAGCTTTVERALRGVAGVASASVNLALARATVRGSSTGAVPDAAALVRAVQAAGYAAAPVERLPQADAALAAARAAELRGQRRRLVAALVLGAPLIALHAAHWLPAPLAGLHHAAAALLETRYGWAAQAVVALAVMLLAAGPMLRGAARALRRGSANMDLLVSLGTLTAYASGLVGLLINDAALILFEPAAMIVLFVGVGKYLEARARGAAAAALTALARRIPREALRIVDGGTEPVPIEWVRPGDLLRVPPHQLVPVDGQVVAGHAAVDESLLTGESLPVERRPGDHVLGGTRVSDGVLDLRATATGEQSAAARIARLVAQAQESKPPWQRLADRLASVFVPAVVALALLTLIGWLGPGQADFIAALQRMIAVLVVACPCALGLAIPTAVLVATTRAAERGILVRDAAALEAIGAVRDVWLDKTGTLTLGRPTLLRVETAADVEEQEILRLAAALEQLTEHPLGAAIVRAARDRRLELPTVESLESQPGGGLRARVAGATVAVGSVSWLEANGVACGAHLERADALAAQGASVVWVARDGRVLGLLALADTLHPDSAAAVAELRRLGVRIRILSGDRHAAVSRVAGELGIPAFESQLTPAQKLERVREHSAHRGHLALVGDGINDAPALAAADVGIAIGTGADVARQAAPICLVAHSPRLIPAAIRLARAGTRIMRQNLAWALLYNLAMLPAAMVTALPPALAAAAMMLSSLTVVLNSLRLRRAA